MENVILIRPKTVQHLGFVYSGMSDLPDLIRFVGRPPVINADLTLNFKKVVVKEGDVVLRNSFGDVTSVIAVDKLEENFDIVKSFDFAPEHINKVQEKVKNIVEKEKVKKITEKKKEKK